MKFGNADERASCYYKAAEEAGGYSGETGMSAGKFDRLRYWRSFLPGLVCSGHIQHDESRYWQQ